MGGGGGDLGPRPPKEFFLLRGQYLNTFSFNIAILKNGTCCTYQWRIQKSTRKGGGGVLEARNFSFTQLMRLQIASFTTS